MTEIIIITIGYLIILLMMSFIIYHQIIKNEELIEKNLKLEKQIEQLNKDNIDIWIRTTWALNKDGYETLK